MSMANNSATSISNTSSINDSEQNVKAIVEFRRTKGEEEENLGDTEIAEGKMEDVTLASPEKPLVNDNSTPSTLMKQLT